MPLRATSRHAGGEGRASMIPDGGRGPRARENGRGRGNLTFRNRVIFVTQMRGLIEDLRQCERQMDYSQAPTVPGLRIRHLLARGNDYHVEMVIVDLTLLIRAGRIYSRSQNSSPVILRWPTTGSCGLYIPHFHDTIEGKPSIVNLLSLYQSAFD